MAGTKRSAPSKVAPAAKAAKKGAATTSLKKHDLVPSLKKPLGEVAAGLALAGLPPSALDMLQAVLPASLAVAADQRSPHQQEMVEILGGQLADVAERMRKRVEECEARVAESETSKEDVINQGGAKSEEISAKEAEVQTAKKELAVAAHGYQAARAAREAAQAKCSAQESEIALASLEKSQLESIATEQFRPLADGGVEAAELQSRIDQLVKALEPFKLEDSMMLAIPSVLSKAPAARASFDTMVLTSIEEELQKRTNKVQTRILQADPEKAALATVLGSAKVEVVDTSKVQVTTAESFMKLQAAKETLEREWQTLQEELARVRDGVRKGKKECAAARRSLAKFQDGSFTTFVTLRDAKSEAPEVPAVLGHTEEVAAS